MLHLVGGRARIAVLLVGAVALAGCAGTATTSSTARTTAPATPGATGATPGATAPAATTASPSADRFADLAPRSPTTSLATVAVRDLPAEAIVTLELIRDGGPFPFDRDGARFNNREGLLPRQPAGFYAEYTVITPGEDDRGARRIVAGDDGSRFYTSDHYARFREVVSR